MEQRTPDSAWQKSNPIPSPSGLTIPVEVWIPILRHLRRPIPPPLSKPHRSALRQPELASASYVCRFFNRVCNSILYTHIVTDDLPRLLSNFHLLSNRQRFKNTRSLYIEYSDRMQVVDEAGYQELLGSGGAELWGGCGIKCSVSRGENGELCEEEMSALMNSLRGVSEQAKGGPSFPRLGTVAVASIYGISGNWLEYDKSDEASERLVECCTEFDSFLRDLPVLQHLCVRDSIGPLSILSSAFSSDRPSLKHTQTVHSPPVINDLPLPFGFDTPIRFTVDHTKTDDCATIICSLEGMLRRASMFRKQNRAYGKAGSTKWDTANLEVYLSSPRFRAKPPVPSLRSFGIIPKGQTRVLSVAEERAMVDRLGRATQEFLRRDSGAEDKVVWRISADYPGCEACGTGPPV